MKIRKGFSGGSGNRESAQRATIPERSLFLRKQWDARANLRALLRIGHLSKHIDHHGVLF